MKKFVYTYLIALATLLISASSMAQTADPPVPVIATDWTRIASNPDLGKYNSDRQQPVDFGVWQAADGTWQLWSCIRGSNYPGMPYTTRFLYGWEGESPLQADWEPQGIKWTAKPELGETPGGMQAPYVFEEDGTWYLFYGDWHRICLATGKDGKEFKRFRGENGEPGLFTEHTTSGTGNNRARDPMVIKRGNTYYCYYTSHIDDPVNDGWAFCRTSLDRIHWTESVKVSHTPPYPGNSPRYSDECPHVVYLPEHELYYLFVTQMYGKNMQTTVYASPTPVYFGIDDNQRKVCTLPVAAPEILFHEGKYYIYSLTPGLDGIRVAGLEWRAGSR